MKIVYIVVNDINKMGYCN